MTWLTGYGYRVKGSVVATAAGAQTLYQMKLLVGESSGASGEDVDCGGYCSDFPNDIRFTGADGVTKHDYWVQTITGTTPNRLATIWIEVATIPASGAVDFYMYYGKSGDGGESSGDNTFVLYNITGVQAFYHMDEASWNGTPGEVTDETGVNDGVRGGGANTIAGGKFNRCGNFDGSNDYINCGNNAGFNMNNKDMTFSLWAKASDLVGYRSAFGKQLNSAPWTGYWLNIVDGANEKITFACTGSSALIANDAQNTNWNHIFILKNGTNIKMYINNVKQTSEITYAQDTDNVRPFAIAGTRIEAPNFHGLVDELIAFSRAITEAERIAIYNNYMQKMGSYYNVRKWADTDPTWGTWGGGTEGVGTRCYAYIIG